MNHLPTRSAKQDQRIPPPKYTKEPVHSTAPICKTTSVIPKNVREPAYSLKSLLLFV